MAKDVDQNTISEGDLVEVVDQGGGTFIKIGEIYTVTGLRLSKISLKEKGSLWWSGHRFRLCKGRQAATIEDKAERIMALINQRPWSPSKDEILEILKS